ncbi:MAG: PfkB family carbohydrate kinase [Cytophagales bacterium]|nr:PfkB family carbohydrate kinase [Cytophagales bacterium]MDW8384508.1 PfkB family carbohydrate kinase [Flammeovirgaceae bacterium]
MSVLVVGSVAFDAIETPFGKTDKIIGGAATFIALAASYFTKKINLISVVGGDFPKDKIALMQRKGINTEGLQIKENEKSFFWAGRYYNDLNTRDTLITELNVLANFDPIVPPSYQDCQFLMLGNLTPTIQRTVIERLHRRPRLIVMDTMNFWIQTAYEELLKTLKLVDVLSINDEEARMLSGEYSLVKAAKKILSLGPKVLVVKKGEHGALLFKEHRVFFAPALPLEEVFDPTGAGDSFAGGFIGYLAKTNDVSFENMKRAVLFGSAMASFCVQKFGTEALLDISDYQLNERVRQFVDLMQLEGEI